MHLQRLFIFLSLFTITLFAQEAEKKPINLSMVISGGVSLGAYEAGYNWAMIKMLSNVKNHSQIAEPHLRSVTGASAGSINALLSAMYWCQKEEVTDTNTIENNLFYNTWVKLGLKDLIINGRDPHNKSTLFKRDTLRIRAKEILAHLDKPIYQKGCEVPLGFSVTKAQPIVREFQKSGIKIKNQHFAVPLTLKEQNGHLQLFNRKMPPSSEYHISIPELDYDNSKVIDVLFASSAFPGAFQQIKLDYIFEGKRKSSYFIDGGAYDNLPLQLASELDKRANDFIFMDPSNMRKEREVTQEEEKEEQPPIGFLSSNALPLLNAVDIFQSMRLYTAISQYFGEDSGNKLILSSRYHPITGKFLGHFGAFLSEDFRIYDYHVGVYDAIYHLSKSMQERGYFSQLSQAQLMNQLKKPLGIQGKTLDAYNLFFQTEFQGLKKIKVNNCFSSIYTAFNHQKIDEKRYDSNEFNSFLKKLNMDYMQDNNSFIPKEKKLLSEWYKTPMNLIINRISTLENDYAEVEGNSKVLAKVTNMMAWIGNSLIKKKEGFHRAVNLPEDKENESLVKVLKALPSEFTNDIKNGGFGFAYNAYWYQEESFIDAYETKFSYNHHQGMSDTLRFDLNGFQEYDDFYKIGVGASLFGNLDNNFYQETGAYGLNAYVDVLDIFRLTYVHRINHPVEKNFIYFGIRNIPSLFYWLQR